MARSMPIRHIRESKTSEARSSLQNKVKALDMQIFSRIVKIMKMLQ